MIWNPFAYNNNKEKEETKCRLGIFVWTNEVHKMSRQEFSYVRDAILIQVAYIVNPSLRISKRPAFPEGGQAPDSCDGVLCF